jgi:hypothetical protein
MQRRSFIGGLIAGLAALCGVKPKREFVVTVGVSDYGFTDDADQPIAVLDFYDNKPDRNDWRIATASLPRGIAEMRYKRIDAETIMCDWCKCYQTIAKDGQPVTWGGEPLTSGFAWNVYGNPIYQPTASSNSRSFFA